MDDLFQCFFQATIKMLSLPSSRQEVEFREKKSVQNMNSNITRLVERRGKQKPLGCHQFSS